MGGGIGMENTCKPMAVSFQCMTKSTKIKKIIIIKKIKFYIGKKIKSWEINVCLEISAAQKNFIYTDFQWTYRKQFIFVLLCFF